MQRSSIVASLVLMPIAVFFWVIGWSLYWIGSKKESARLKQKLAVQKELTMFVPTLEQKYAS